MIRRLPLLGVWLLSAIALPTLSAAEADRDDPQIELRAFKVADGYDVHLFASEKDGIVKPVQMRWDARGRLWVSCIPSYPQLRPNEKPDDRIVILADTDGSGVANYSHVFARGLSLPLGLELGHGGLYVTNGSDLLFLQETRGIDEADASRVVLSGFFSADSHQNINSFVWGPGGELMFCQGLHAFAHVETPWGNASMEKAGVWRLWPRTLQLQNFLGSDRGPQNPWGVVFDDWGQPLMIAGNGQGIYYLLPSLIQTDHFLDPHQIWDHNMKLCGCDIIGTSAMPRGAQGRMVAGSILDNSVYLFDIDDAGAGFKVRKFLPLIVSSHSSFRPVDAKVGPDGAIYIADWYNPIIGHYQASLRHPDRDHAHGRIWRITAKDRPPVSAPPLATFSTPQLLEQLKSPERWVRYQAKRLLSAKGQGEVREALAKFVASLKPDAPDLEHTLVETLGVYQEQEIVDPALLQSLLAARDERARAYATGAIGHWADRLPNAVALLKRQATDPSPRVRLAAVVAASSVPSAQAMDAAAQVVDQPMDEFLTNALTQCVHALKPYWKPELDAGRLTFDGVAARMSFVLKADGSSDVLGTLQRLLKSSQPGDAAHDNALALIATLGSADDALKALADPSVQNASRDELTGRVLKAVLENPSTAHQPPAGDAVAILKPLIDARSPSTRADAIRLAGVWRLEALRPQMVATAQKPDEPLPVRAASMDALASLGGSDSVDRLDQLARTAEALPSRTCAIAALSRIDLMRAAQAAALALPQASSFSDVNALLLPLLARQDGAEALVAALANQKLSPDCARLSLRAMSSAGRQDAPLWNLFANAAGASAARHAYDPAIVKTLADEAIANGDPAAGETVFRGATANCLSCHSIGGAGGHVGPDLATVGTAMPIDLVVESVLWPNKQVKEGYMATMVQTRDGDIVEGYVVSDEKDQLTLRDPTNDRVYRFPISQIKRRKEVGSMMPDGVTDGLTHAELRDLIRFLCELGKPGPYRVSTAPIVRLWETAGALPAGEAASASQASAPPPALEAATWQPHFATVAGALPLSDIPLAANARFAYARCSLRITSAGRFNLQFNDPRGLIAWLDGQPLDLSKPAPIDLGVGDHRLLLEVDPAARAGAGLQCLVSPTGSGGDVSLPGSILH